MNQNKKCNCEGCGQLFEKLNRYGLCENCSWNISLIDEPKNNIDKIMERTANHIGIISMGSLKTLADEIRQETIKECIDSLPEELNNDGNVCIGWNVLLKEVKENLNKLK